MNQTEVMALLKENQNERGIKNWDDGHSKDSGLKSFGIGLTVLRKLAKQVGRDHKLAQSLWNSNVYDAKVIGLLIDEPKLITREQIEDQVENLSGGYLAHVFSACGATLANTSFAQELATDWIDSDDSMRERCGYGLVYEFSKSKKKSAPDDAFFLDVIKRVDKTFKKKDIDVQMAMGGAIMGMGMRNITLHTPALKVARKICPIDFDPTGKCDPFDAVKHLTGDYATQKLGL